MENKTSNGAICRALLTESGFPGAPTILSSKMPNATTAEICGDRMTVLTVSNTPRPVFLNLFP